MNKELIELIINALNSGKEMDTYTLYKLCETMGYKRGTYTSYISMMKKAGYVRRVKPRVYAIGKMASTQTIDHNLRRLSIHNKHIKRPKLSEQPLDKLTDTIKKTEMPNEDISVIRARRVGEAIEVLKSYGIKLTLEI